MEWVLHALRAIVHRARLNGRETVTANDLEWAIQELEKNFPMIVDGAVTQETP